MGILKPLVEIMADLESNMEDKETLVLRLLVLTLEAGRRWRNTEFWLIEQWPYYFGVVI